MPMVSMGGVSYLSQTRHIQLLQAEFVLYLTGTRCTAEQTANTKQRVACRETDQEGVESVRVVLLY